MGTWKDFEGLNSISDDYKYQVAENLIKNELGGVSDGYSLAHAGTGNSGWSFGGHQYDLSVNSDGQALIKDILDHEFGTQYYTSIEDNLLEARNPNSLDTQDIIKINQALNSEYGKEKINEDFLTAVDEVCNHIDAVETKLGVTLSDGEKLMLADYHNQYGLSLNSSSPASLINKMSNEIQQSGDITKEDLKTFFEETKYYLDNPTSQGTRIDNTYENAIKLDSNTQASLGIQGINDLEEITKNYVQMHEPNKEEKLANLDSIFSQINSQENLENKLSLLANSDITSNFENEYCKQYLSQYQEKLISNEGNPLSYTDILNIEIKPNFDFNNFNSLAKNDYIYEPFSSKNDNNSNSNSNIQTIS